MLYLDMSETSVPLERALKVPVINFEPGIHPIKESENTAISQAANNGDLTAHAWNAEVGNRIKRRGFNKTAMVISVDGDSPISAWSGLTENNSNINFVSWVLLPARPSELNSSNSVYLLRADTNDNFTPIISRGGKPDLDRDDPDLQYQYIQNAGKSIQLSRVSETFLRPITVLAAMYGASELRRRVFPHTGKDIYSGKISRREFLKLAGVFSAALLASASPVAGAISGELASKTKSESVKDFLLKIDQIASARLFMDDWVDARTGLMYSKMEDIAISNVAFPADTDFSIVLGHSHNTNQATMEENRDARNKKIHSYAKRMIRDGKTAYSIFAGIPESEVPQEAINRLLDYLTLAQIVKVTDPGGGDKDPNFVSKINNYFTTIATYNSPQVEEAIRDLRPS